MSEPVRMRDIVVIGGGCYGTFYAGQLAKARARGKAEYRRVLVVDHDRACRAARELTAVPQLEIVVTEWSDFFDEFLTPARRTAPGAPADYLVPPPPESALATPALRRPQRGGPVI